MSFITIDFETFYSKDYSLTKLTTEEYVNHPMFEVILFSIKVDDQPVQWYTGTHEEVKSALLQYDWANSALLAHNTAFDGFILSRIFNIRPKYLFDTLSMARASLGTQVGGSLAKLVKHFGLGEKGTEVINALGKRRKDFSDYDLFAYAGYCMNDTELTYKLFNTLMAQGFPESELDLIDQTLKMYTDPVLELNIDTLEERLGQVKYEKEVMMNDLREELGCRTALEVQKKLASNKVFQQVLQERGVFVPTKTSPTTGESVPAFAKTDLGFIELETHPDPMIQQLCAARLGAKSTMEESRLQNFIGIALRNLRLLPIPLTYYGAHTGRWSGTGGGINLQNIPQRDAKKRALKDAITAPKGYVVINADSAQIEARVLAWLSGQTNLVKMFADGVDVYSDFASKVFRRIITKADKAERFVGKTAILGLGFQTSYKKLYATLASQRDFELKISEDECKNIVGLYRGTYLKIPELWRSGDSALQFIMQWPARGDVMHLDPHKLLLVSGMGIRLPNGLWLKYPNLQVAQKKSKSGYPVITYESRKGPVDIYGGKVVENFTQAVARVIVGEQLLTVAKRYRVALTVHDSIVLVVPESQREEAMGYTTAIMSTAPSWAPGLPLSCEVKSGPSYGLCE